MRPDRPPGQDDDDRLLLRAHVEGDPDAFGTLFARHRDRLWAVALRTTGDPEEAADALQDAMVTAFRRASTYRGDAAVTTWLHRVVVNACLDRLRRARVRRADPLPDDPASGSVGTPVGSATHASVPVPDPADVTVASERRTAILAGLEALPLEQRAALVLVDMEGYSVEEAAGILGCAPGTVKSRCSRGRARLLPLLAEHRPSTPRRGPVGPPEGDPDRNPRATPRVGTAGPAVDEGGELR